MHSWTATGLTPATPSPAERWIPALTSDRVIQHWHSVYAMKCTGPTTAGDLLTWTCTPTTPDDSAYLTIVILGTAPDRITSVATTVLQLGTEPAGQTAAWLRLAGMLPYRGADPLQAGQWVADHLLTKGSTKIGPVKFSLTGSNTERTLELSAGAAGP